MDIATRESISCRLMYPSRLEDCLSVEAIQVIYNGTRRDDLMRLELCDTYTKCDNMELLGGLFHDHNDAAKLPPEFLLDLARHLNYVRPTDTQLNSIIEQRNAGRNKILDLTEQLAKLDTKHKETQPKLESMTKAFEDMKAQCNDIKAKLEGKNEELKSKDQVIREKDDNISDKVLEIRTKDSTIANKDQTIKDKDQTIKDKNQTIKKKDQAIQALKDEQAAYNKQIIDKLIVASKK